MTNNSLRHTILTSCFTRVPELPAGAQALPYGADTIHFDGAHLYLSGPSCTGIIRDGLVAGYAAEHWHRELRKMQRAATTPAVQPATATAAKTPHEMIEGIPAGKSWGGKAGAGGALVRRFGDGYECEVVWTVPEAYEDDPLSFGGHQYIADGDCYVGRVVRVASAKEAAGVYAEMREALLAMRPYGRGDKIGNVGR